MSATGAGGLGLAGLAGLAGLGSDVPFGTTLKYMRTSGPPQTIESLQLRELIPAATASDDAVTGSEKLNGML